MPDSLSDSMEALADPYVGLVSGISSLEMEPTDPSIFLANAKLADLTVYGFPPGAGGHGGAGAGLTRKQALLAALGEAAERYSLAVIPSDLMCETAQHLQEK